MNIPQRNRVHSRLLATQASHTGVLPAVMSIRPSERGPVSNSAGAKRLMPAAFAALSRPILICCALWARNLDNGHDSLDVLQSLNHRLLRSVIDIANLSTVALAWLRNIGLLFARENQRCVLSFLQCGHNSSTKTGRSSSCDCNDSHGVRRLERRRRADPDEDQWCKCVEIECSTEYFLLLFTVGKEPISGRCKVS
jgi:hypothetical protein